MLCPPKDQDFLRPPVMATEFIHNVEQLAKAPAADDVCLTVTLGWL